MMLDWSLEVTGLSENSTRFNLSRRELFGTVAKAAALTPLIGSGIISAAKAEDMAPLNAIAGIDRVTVQPGKTYLRGWAGYGDPPTARPPQGGRGQAPVEAPPPPPGPPPTVTWSKQSGPGTVTFADLKTPITTATFSAPGAYVLKLTAGNGQDTKSSTLDVSVETPPPAQQLDAVYTKNFKINSPLWNARVKALVVNWIPHCIDQINRTDLTQGEGGIDNFIAAGKALRGEPHGSHKGYVFSNAWVHQTVEAMSIALMIDPQGDADILKAHEKFRKTLDEWIPIILAAQEPDGYLQTAFTVPTPRRVPLPPVPVKKADGTVISARVTVTQAPDGSLRAGRGGFGGGNGGGRGAAQDAPFTADTSTTVSMPVQSPDGTSTDFRLYFSQNADGTISVTKVTGANPDGKPDTVVKEQPPVIPVLKHWDPPTRGNHEGYTAGYFLESAINHYLMTKKQDARLYNAAKKLADCWYSNLGPAPKKPWFDGHQEMEQALVRFGRFVNDNEGGGKGQKYIDLAKFLLDCRYNAAIPRQGPNGVTFDDRSEYDQSHLPVVQQYEAVGHAVRAMYTYSGMADVAVETHDPDYQSAVKSLWDNVVNKKYYVTGGVGSGESSEGFGPNYSLGNRAYCEACSTCGEIFFHWKMNLAYHDARYADMYEAAMYNALLGATDLEGKNFFYDNPLDEYKVRYPWHVCPCCVGNIPRTLLMFPTWTYAKAADGVYVNMFVGSTIMLENVGGTDVEMVQETDYPWSGKVAITLNPKTAKSFSVRMRVPNRNVSKLYPAAPDADGVTSLHVNGTAVKPVITNGYAVVTRNWKAGDKIELVVPMKVQRVHADERIVPDRGKVALRYGPVMYSIEQVDEDITKTLAPDSPLSTEWKADLLGGVMVIKGKFSDGSPMTAVPNYARMNRGPAPPPPPPRPAPGTPVPAASAAGGGGRGFRPTLSSVVWIKEV